MNMQFADRQELKRYLGSDFDDLIGTVGPTRDRFHQGVRTVAKLGDDWALDSEVLDLDD